MNQFALRFISGKYQGGEFPLTDDAEVVIGRGGELDIVLVEDMVSRKHAKINTGGGGIAIQDLGSTNGTFVNGERITRARLQEGDRVLIGTSILKLIAQAGASGPDVRDPTFQANAQNASANTMSGSLGDIALPDLLQLFSTSKKNGVLALTNTEDCGRIYMRDGKVYYASFNDTEDLDPIKALNRMLRWEEGEFQLGPPSDDEFMLEIGEQIDHLIMDGIRQMDEMKIIQDDLPELEDMLQVAKPLTAPLAGLNKNELEVFQLVFNNGFFQSVLDESPFTDLLTSQLVKKLVDGEFIYF
ncbi:MAG: DUF4388 domain-containing protein [Deltaproteobacteria bacterium]|nr:DUF4388 domain-containing protein [Deltaproteobacteria bacterium]